jgi:regulator of PEP synthase PpsR (kinase-PPPase family)
MPTMNTDNPPVSRLVYIVSDGTGITAENFSQSILAQFEASFKQIRIPFVDTVEKAHDAVIQINGANPKYGQAIVFTTLVNPEVNQVVGKANALVLDMFQTFVAPLEQTLGMRSTHAINRLHHNADTDAYKNRIEAINYSLAHDDGQSNQNLADANVILVGVSRVGKTPTSLYLAMQYGLKAANYPLIPEDFERGQLPKDLLPHKQKIYGLTIDADRLCEIRNERRPGSNYAKLENCRYEINEATSMMRRESIPWVSTTSKSIEEIATTILQAIRSDKNILG